MRAIKLALIVAAAFTAQPASAQPATFERPPSPASRLFPYLDRYLSLPPAERTLFRPFYRVHVNGAPARGLKAWLVRGGAREPIAIEPDGRVERLPTAAQLAGAMVQTDAPKNVKLSVGLGIAATAPPSVQMSAADLARAVRQADAGIHKAAGFLGALAPKLDRVILHDATGARAVTAAGKSSDLPGSPPSASLAVLDSAATLRFVRPPSLIEIDEPARK